MANTLHIYGGDIHAGAQDGDMITNERRITLAGLKDSSTAKMFALRAQSASYPACVVKTYFAGTEADKFELSLDGSNWVKKLSNVYIKDANILFFIRASIDEDADYGIHAGTYLVNDYLGGV